MKTRFTPLHRALFAAALVAGTSLAARAQSVGIGTTAPDASAALDVVATDKGALLPRMTALGRGAITAPATGLIVFQTDGATGFYYNTGTPSAPVWQQIATAAGTSTGFIQNQNAVDQAANFRINGTGSVLGRLGAGTSAPQLGLDAAGGSSSIGLRNGAAWDHLYMFHDGSTSFLRAGGAETGLALQVGASATGTYGDASQAYRDVMRLLPSGNVGIGTTNPQNLLDLGNGFGGNATDAATKKLAVFQSGNDFYGLGVSAGQMHLFANATATGAPKMTFNANGNVGIGDANPLTRLSITPVTLEPKITLYEGGGNINHYGLGISGFQQNYHVGSNNGSHVFYAGGTNGDGNELMRIRNTGNVGIGTSAPTQKLEVLGSVFAHGENTGFLSDAGPNARVGLIKYAFRESGIWRTSAQDFEIGRVDAAVTGLPGTPTTWTTDLYVGGTGNVGIGTTTPAQRLDVAGGNIRIGTAGSGLIFPDGTTQTTAATSAGLITANNGLTRTANNIALGGTLTQATTIAQGSNAFSLTGGNVGIGTAAPATTLDVNGSFNVTTSSTAAAQISQPTKNTTISGGGTTGGQSFTMPAAGTITAFTLEFTSAVTTTVTFFQGAGNGGTQLTAPQTVTFAANTVQTVPLTAPLAVGAGVYTMVLGGLNNHCSNANPYAGGGLTLGTNTTAFGGTIDLLFGIDYTTGTSGTTLFANTGNVGIGTTAPTANLDVVGSTRLRGLSTAGLVTTDASGNLSSGSAASLDATTASNGLTEVGNDVRLGGALTQATAISGVTTANTFDISGTAAPRLTNTTAASAAGNRVLTLKTNYANTIAGSGGHLSFTDGSDGEFGRIASRDEGGAGGIVGLTFSTNNGGAGGGANFAERLRIAGNGNVGIGTTTPTATLDVNGTAKANSVTSLNGILLDVNGTNDGTFNGQNALKFGAGNSGEGVGSKRTATGNQFGLDLFTGYTSRLSVTNAGNVGIGTTAPTATLDVNGSTRVRGLTAGVVSAAADGTLSSSSATTAFGTSFIQNQNTADQAANFRINGTGYIGGNVGIGTTAPTTQLANTNLNIIGTDANGISTQAFNWLSTTNGYAGAFYSSHNAGNGNGLAVKVLNTGAVALDVSQGATAGAAGASLLRINGNGNVGIGTAAPTAKLQVVSADNTFATNITDVQAQNLTQGIGTYYSGLRKTGTNLNGEFNIDAKGTGSLVLNANGGTGNVGIGTAGPAQKLDVVGNIQASDNLVVNGANNNTGVLGSSLRFGQANSGEAIGSKRTAGVNQFGLDFYTQSTLRMTVANNGSVGIATNAPALGLDVANGSMGFRTGAAWDHMYQVHDGSTAVLRAGGAETGLSLQVGVGATGTYGDASQAYRDVMRLLPSGNVGIGTATPVAGLHIDRPQAATQGLGVVLSGGTSGNPSMELRGNTGAVPFIDFSENPTSDFSTRLISQGGTMNVQTSVAGATALNVGGFVELDGVNAGAAPAIAIAKVISTIPGAANSQVIIALPAGVTREKVLSLTGMAGVAAGDSYPPNNGVTTSGNAHHYQLYINANNIIINTDNNSSSLFNAPVRILITYEK